MDANYEQQSKRATRHERKRQRLGSPAPTCLSCGGLKILALLSVPARHLPQWFLEAHHIPGRAISTFTVNVCRNCHGILTDRQHDWDPRLRRPQIPPHRLAALLQALADWFRLLGAWLIDLAEYIDEWIRWILGGMVGPGPGGTET